VKVSGKAEEGTKRAQGVMVLQALFELEKYSANLELFPCHSYAVTIIILSFVTRKRRNASKERIIDLSSL
jgi:hypothetical protein